MCSSANKSSTKRDKATINETPNRAPYKRRRVQVKPQTRGLKRKSSKINIAKSGERESFCDSHTSEADPCHQEQPSPPSRVNINANSPQARAPSDNKVHQETSPNGTAPDDPHVACKIPKDDDGGDVDPTMPSFNLGINQDEIDVSGRLSPKTVDVAGSPLVPIRVIIPPDFNEIE
ncbi:hypothetical protein PIB30_042859 [Stylosanthes scabra]|uniref:Uncharacterized protein n=1 Tax=Stylosanthes scabra TaxID=79078 RepID=A0ABU6YCR4_9FABA|nr:hypothetical protein [Stylosanthes scabra]